VWFRADAGCTFLVTSIGVAPHTVDADMFRLEEGAREMATYPASTPNRLPATETTSGSFWIVATMLLGFAVGVICIFVVLMWSDAHQARDAAQASSTPATTNTSGQGSMAGMDMSGTTAAAGGLTSYAGAAPTNATALAAAHRPYPAALPPAPAGPVADVHLVLKDVTVQIAPGVKYAAWAWAGGAPGPVIHVRQGQLVRITLTNDGAIPHSVDFHAARIAPDKAFADVLPGKSVSYSFRAEDAGVFMYHCGTKPVLMHIANGMYGAIVVEPRPGVLPKADKNYVLVASEWYLGSDGLRTPAQFDMAKAHARQPDWMTFNGYAGQYVTHPLTAKPGQLVRFWVVDAGPSLDTDFHVVGTLLNTAYPFGDINPAHALTDVQTATVPAGGGGVFDVKIDKPGLYPFVSHAFAAVDEGQVGVLRVGDVPGTMSH
jgi:nitrite reductase (NO-forming)